VYASTPALVFFFSLVSAYCLYSVRAFIVILLHLYIFWSLSPFLLLFHPPSPTPPL
jgi:hypothetical protein